jgi:hypothetical protein
MALFLASERKVRGLRRDGLDAQGRNGHSSSSASSHRGACGMIGPMHRQGRPMFTIGGKACVVVCLICRRCMTRRTHGGCLRRRRSRRTLAGVCGRLVLLGRCIRSSLWCIGGRLVRGCRRGLFAMSSCMPCLSFRVCFRALSGCGRVATVDAVFPYPAGAGFYCGSAFAYAGEGVTSWWSFAVWRVLK